MTQRLLDWRSRLRVWADLQVGRPFVWGETDCASLARAALEQLFGMDVLGHLPRWETPREALQVLQQYGPIGRILEDIGAARTSVPFMRSGDLVVAEEVEEEVGGRALLVCIDGQQCLTGSHDGVVFTTPHAQCVVYSLWEASAHG